MGVDPERGARPAGRRHAAERAHRDRVVAAEHERQCGRASAASHDLRGDLLADAHDRRRRSERRRRPRRSSPGPASRRRPSRRPRGRATAGARSALRSGSPTAPCRRRAGPARGRARRRSPRRACGVAARSPQCSRRPKATTAAATTAARAGEVAQLVEHTAENRGVAGSSPALAIRRTAGKKRRPDRCYRVANVSCRRAYDRSFLRASRLSPGPDEKIATCEKLRRSSSRLNPLERHPDRGRRAPAVRDRDLPSGSRDPSELVEERDHVVHRHELERAVVVRQPRGVGDLVALRRRVVASRLASLTISPETSTPTTSASGQRAGDEARDDAAARAEIEDACPAGARRRRAQRASRRARPRARAWRPTRAPAGRSSRSAGGGRPARAGTRTTIVVTSRANH